MCYVDATLRKEYLARMNASARGITISAGVFFRDGTGASCAVVRGMDGMPRTQGWILGRDPGKEPPIFLQEGGLLRALLLPEQCVVSEKQCPPFFYVQAGTWRMTRGLQEWFNNGHPPLQSAAGTDLIAVLHRLGALLPCPLIVTPLPREFFDDAQMQGSRDCDLLMAASLRLYELVLPLAYEAWGTQIARIPWTEADAKKFCKQKYRSDETEAVNMLCAEGSVASSIYGELHLTRSIIKEMFTKLHNDRRRRTVFAGIICATRFEALNADGLLQPAICMRCGGQDSFAHLLSCSDLGSLPDDGSPEELMDYLIALVREAARGAPLVPIRFLLPEVGKISLTAVSGGSVGEQSLSDASLDSLSFEISEADE